MGKNMWPGKMDARLENRTRRSCPCCVLKLSPVFHDSRFDLIFLGAERATDRAANPHAGKPVCKPGCGGVDFHLECGDELRRFLVA